MVGSAAKKLFYDQKAIFLTALCVLSVLFSQIPFPPFGGLGLGQHGFQASGLFLEAVNFDFEPVGPRVIFHHLR